MSRFGPAVARSILVQQHRSMASAATATDPVQKLFVEKIREFKSANKGLDEAHQKALHDENLRLKRVFSVDDENKLAHIEAKFPSEVNVSLRDLDETKELRRKIVSGEYQKQLTAETTQQSELLATIPDQTRHEMHLPPMNKPDYAWIEQHSGPPKPTGLASEVRPDYEYIGGKMTPEKLERELDVHFDVERMPTIHDDTKPGRDAVNFPRWTMSNQTPPTRYHIVPESWFQFLYPKLGVTGPYTLFAGVSTFLMSKEWVPIEHEFLSILSTTLLITIGVSKYGPMVSKYLIALQEKDCKDWDNWQHVNIDTLTKMKEHYSRELTKGGVMEDIYEARRQDIDVQLECEHRNRVKAVYEDTKRRLNYLVAKADSTRQIHHANMVNWVISNVMSSIGGQKQENDVLDNCVLNLKQLASKNAKSI